MENEPVAFEPLITGIPIESLIYEPPLEVHTFFGNIASGAGGVKYIQASGGKRVKILYAAIYTGAGGEGWVYRDGASEPYIVIRSTPSFPVNQEFPDLVSERNGYFRIGNEGAAFMSCFILYTFV